jgi:SAM-dependent methyltransferase
MGRAAALVSLLLAALGAVAADVVFTPFESAAPVLAAFAKELPSGLQVANASSWRTWSGRQDAAIRERLDLGDVDSMVNLLLFGTSFTAEPRIEIETLAEASRAGLLRARLRDLLNGLQTPAGNERLIYLGDLLRNKGMLPADPRTGTFILQNLERVLKERIDLGPRANESSVFRDRGVSLDATLLPNVGIEEALRTASREGILKRGEVRRVAVIGPGLDFIDKDSGYDYYPQQTLQPFAVYDSLARLGLLHESLRVTVLDISPRVLNHIRMAREKAARGEPYLVQLPHAGGRRWTDQVNGFWRAFGDQTGMDTAPIKPPAALSNMVTRAAAIRPSVVSAIDAAGVNIVLQRLDLPERDRFDLVVATNLFVYYGPLEQALALENVAAMLRAGGLLLSNDRLPEAPSVMPAATTTVVYSEAPRIVDVVFSYRKP